MTESTSFKLMSPNAKVRKLVIASIFWAGCLIPQYSAANDSGSSLRNDPFRLSINRPAGTPYYSWFISVYKDVFTRVGLPLQTIYHPIKMATAEACSGRVDGEAARIASYGNACPNLVRVKEPLFMMNVAVYASSSNEIIVDSWESLRELDIKIGYPKGMKLSENRLSVYTKPERLYPAITTLQGIKKAAQGQTSIFIDDSNAVNPLITDVERREPWLATVQKVSTIETVPLYMYIHKKHLELEPYFSKAIREIKKEGMIEVYRVRAFSKK